MFHNVWHPTEDDLKNFKFLFMVSIPAVMILPLILNILIPSQVWYLLAFFWLMITIALRIISGIRYSVITSHEIMSDNKTFLARLTEDDRKKFLMTACVYTPICFVVGTTLALFVINLMSPVGFTDVVIVGGGCLSIIIYSLWNCYNKLAQGKEDIL